MCSRYFLDLESEDVQEMISEIARKLSGEQTAALKTGEIFPTDFALVMTQSGPCPMKWGFPRTGGKGVVINARSETILEKPMFRKPLMEGMRCLVPAARYFEWQAVSGGKKVKYAIYDPASPVLYMASLYRFIKETGLPAFVILTREADLNLAAIHSRMPVIPSIEQAFLWLNASPKADITATRTLSYEPVLSAPKETAPARQLSFFPEE